jgi:hypothetical protein
MKFHNGVQFNAHQEFIKFKHRLKNDRIRAGKEENGKLSDKRLSLMFVRFLSLPENYPKLVNANIDLNEE